MTRGSDYPVMKHGERITPEKAAEIVAGVKRDGETLLRTAGDWNTASTLKARMQGSKSFEPHTETVDFFCRRIGPEVIGLYLVPARG